MKTQAMQVHLLPSFTALSAPYFQWSEKDGEYLIQIVDCCYNGVFEVIGQVESLHATFIATPSSAELSA